MKMGSSHEGTCCRDGSQGLVPSCVPTLRFPLKTVSRVMIADSRSRVQNMIGLVQNSMDKWKTVLTAGSEVLLTRLISNGGIFQGDSLSPLLFVLSLIPLTLVLRKVRAGYDLGNGNGLVNHLLLMDDLKLYGRNESQLDPLIQSVRVVSEDISMEFGISKCATLLRNGEK